MAEAGEIFSSLSTARSDARLAMRALREGWGGAAKLGPIATKWVQEVLESPEATDRMKARAVELALQAGSMVARAASEEAKLAAAEADPTDRHEVVLRVVFDDAG